MVIGPYVHDLVGSMVALRKDAVVVVGREGDLAFPDNEHLHRRLLAIYWRDESWWIENVGTWIPVRYSAKGVAVSSLLEVGRAVRISSAETHIVFRAGKVEYEIAVVVPDLVVPDRSIARPSAGVSTIGPDELTDEQIMMLVAFCEPLLKYPGVGIDRIVSMKEAQDRLGWSGAKLRRKLDYLCTKLAEAGIAGLVSDDGPATNRRIVLCEWALATRAITAAQLRLLP